MPLAPFECCCQPSAAILVQLELLFLSLLPKYRIGIFSSATERTVLKGIGAIKSYLLSERFPSKPSKAA